MMNGQRPQVYHPQTDLNAIDGFRFDLANGQAMRQ